jgi:hypothetical protein
LQLTPKVAADYKLADLWIDKDGMPVQGMRTEKNGDTRTVLLSKIVKNRSIKREVFDVIFPRSIKPTRA